MAVVLLLVGCVVDGSGGLLENLDSESDAVKKPGITVSGRTGWANDEDATFRAHEVKLPDYKKLPSASSGSSHVHYEWWTARERYMHGRKNVVAWNDIHDVMETMGDGNAIYISGTGKENRIYQNYIHDIDGDGTASGIRCDNDQYETILDGNVLYKIRSAQTGISTVEMNPLLLLPCSWRVIGSGSSRSITPRGMAY